MESEVNSKCSPVEISVIVPCFNVGNYVRASLESLLNQDFLNFEIVCIDDGSVDDTASILQELADANPGLIHVINKENEGAWLARLDGIRAASGRYITFLDGDDTAQPDFLSAMYSAAVALGSDITVCGFRRIDQDGKIISEEFCSNREDIQLNCDPGRILEVNPAPWNKLFKAEVLKGLPSIDCHPVMFDDLTLLLLSYVNGVNSIGFVSKCLVNYYVREGSQINSVAPSQLEGAREALSSVRSVYERKGVGACMMEALASIAFLHSGISMTFRIISSASDIVNAELLHTKAFLDDIFPEWSNSRYLGFRYACHHGFPALRIWVSALAFKVGLLPAMLSVYNRLIALTGKDLKW